MLKAKKPIIIWLSIVCFMVYLMVFVGGMTRLTDSGLSMVDWRPIMGVIPPITDADWVKTFEAYKQFPEYQQINKGMSLSEFKTIFYWEYFHRILGRLVGLVFFLPLLVFQWRGYLKERKLSIKLWMGLFLGGLQGLMGWYMVKSGLVDKPDVSHFRLAAHLSLALIIFCYLFWILLDLMNLNKANNKKWLKYSAFAFLLLFTQIVWGAFTAGLKAGYGYNTFPLMGDRLIPEGMAMLSGVFNNIFSNPITVQFTHRSLGWLLFILALFFLYTLKPAELTRRQSYSVYAFVFAILGQFLLGVLTLVYFVPLPLAILHQTGAFLLLAIAVQLIHSFS